MMYKADFCKSDGDVFKCCRCSQLYKHYISAQQCCNGEVKKADQNDYWGAYLNLSKPKL